MRYSMQLKDLKHIMTALGKIDRDVHVDASASGWHIAMIDPARVLMATVDITTTAFEKYDTSDATFVLEAPKTLAALKVMDGTQLVQIDVDGGKITLSQKSIKRSYAMPSSEVAKTSKVPNVPDDAHIISIPTSEFNEMLREIEGITDHLYISVNGNVVELSESHQGQEDASTSRVADVVGEGSVKSCYPEDYFKLMMNTFPEGDLILRMMTDYPIFVTCDTGVITYLVILAPRIESD